MPISDNGRFHLCQYPIKLPNGCQLSDDGSGNLVLTDTSGTQTTLNTLLSTLNALTYKGALDCSSNPNYPAADAGDLYIVSVAGKVGGASGATVEAGDLILCKTDGTLAGTQAQKGAAWDVIQTNIIVTWEIKSADFTAVAGHRYQVDTSGGVVTATLPASASVGDEIPIEDATLSWATHNLTLNRNGLKINGGTSNYTANVIGGKLSLVYISAGYGWSIK